MKVGYELIQLVEAADAAGRPEISAKALKSAKVVRDMSLKARAQMPKRKRKTSA
ncbi:hypothetical protein [Mesorhizobium sophorae]|uniref:hypothetical protein n=1 Tax=Mesorhizobium sophorae TaxID=1300294 RepID=UPI00142DA2E2|nr:hypothetical protein [Mesorhizobium sophorae]